MATLEPMSFAMRGYIAFIPEDMIGHFSDDREEGRLTIIGQVQVPVTVEIAAS